MYVTIRRYSIHPGSTQELLEQVRANFLPIISKAPNFVAYYAVDEGDGDISTISIFKDEESAIASNGIAANWAMKNVASLISRPPKIVSGEVVAQAP
jgi:hypothetical protein